MEGKEYTPQVGDKVIITKSETNWGEMMDKYVGQTYYIREIINPSPEHFTVIFAVDEETNDINRWAWVYGHGHFKLFEKKPLKIKIKF